MNFSDAARAKDELADALVSGNAAAIARVAAYHVWPLYSEHFEMLTSAIAGLPSDALERYPMLRVLHPMTAVLARSARPFKPMFYADDSRSMSPEEVDFLYLAQMIAFRLSGDVTAALVYARRLEDRVQQTRIESRDRMDGPLWYFHHQIGSTLLSAGDSSRALLEFATARQLGRLSIQRDAERMALASAALAHAARGSHRDALRSLAEAQQSAAPTAAHANAIRSAETAAVAVIAVDLMSDDRDDSIAAMDPYDSLELSWPFALLARCRDFLSREQPEDALEAIQLAAESHLVQRGSFAADVIAAASIQALLVTGDVTRARRVAEEAAKYGVLTRLATVRMYLHEGRFDAAAHLLSALSGDQTLGPAQRADTVLLSGWLELGRSGGLAPDTALLISRTARRRHCRRQLAVMPRQLMEHVREQLPGDSVVEFDAATAGLTHFEMVSRPVLTPGELRILNALPASRSTAMMASSFHVSPNTVKSQLRTLYRKLGCSTRDDAIRIATRLHLFAGDVKV